MAVVQQIKIQDPNDPFKFEVNGFKIKSISFIFLVLVSLIFSYFGVFFIFGFIALLFICFPVLYKKLLIIPKKLLILSKPIFKIVSLIPFINLDGTWFIEKNSKRVQLRSTKDIIKFIFKNWFIIFLSTTGVIYIGLRLITLSKGNPLNGHIFSILSSVDTFVILSSTPLLLCLYFITVLVWEDAELKITSTKTDSKGIDQNNGNREETESLVYASDSLKSIFALIIGIPSILWLVQNVNQVSSIDFGLLQDIVAIYYIIGLFIYMGGIPILMTVMYYRSGAHEFLVNELRKYIRENSKKSEKNIRIADSYIEQISYDSNNSG